MLNLSIAPAQTIVGPGSLSDIGRIVTQFGRHVFILGGRKGLEVTSDQIGQSLAKAGILFDQATFRGECSHTQIAQWAEAANGYDAMVCIGGGKALDTGKAAAARVGIPCVTIPTSAATCAAITALVVIHSDSGAYDTGEILPHCPEATILDPEVLVKAPERLLAAGIADAVGRARETDLAVQVAIPGLHAKLSHSVTVAYTVPLLELCGEALAACEEGRTNEAFAWTASTCILGAGLASGLCGAFYRLNIAHSVAYGLTHLITEQDSLHGEEVALGLLVQEALQDRSGEKTDALRARLRSWGLAVTFSGIGWDPNTDGGIVALARLVDRFLDHEHAIDIAVSEKRLCEAIEQVEADGKG